MKRILSIMTILTALTVNVANADVPYIDRTIEGNSSAYALSLPDRAYDPSAHYKRAESITVYTDGEHTQKITNLTELDIRNNKYDLLFSDTKPEFRRFLYQQMQANKVNDVVPKTESNTFKAAASANAAAASATDNYNKTAYTDNTGNGGFDLKLILNDKKSSKTIIFPAK